MIQQILITFLLFCGFLGIILFSEYLYKKYNLKAEVTRKMAHVVATLSSLIFLIAIESHWYILTLGILFFLLLFIGKKMGVFNSIDAVSRKTGGSYLLPVSIYLSFLSYDLFENPIYFILPILLLGLSDALAGFAGIRFENRTQKIVLFNQVLHKTYLGTTVFFLSAFIISFFVLYANDFTWSNCLLWSVLIALVTALTEMISDRGLDNLTIPLVTILMIWLSHQ